MEDLRPEEANGPRELREEVRPGLMMRRRREVKPDGRYLFSYEFEREGAPGGLERGRALTEISFHVPEMHCGACEASIRKAVEQLPGIGEVRADLDRRHVHVRFDDAQTDVLAIQGRIERAGFDVG